MPSWLYWMIGVLVLLAVLFLVGVRLHLTTGS